MADQENNPLIDITTWSDEKLDREVRKHISAADIITAEVERRKKEKLPYKIGDMVKNKKGQVFLITRIDVWGFGSAWYKGQLRKIDGKFSLRERHIYDIAGKVEG